MLAYLMILYAYLEQVFVFIAGSNLTYIRLVGGRLEGIVLSELATCWGECSQRNRQWYQSQFAYAFGRLSPLLVLCLMLMQ